MWGIGILTRSGSGRCLRSAMGYRTPRLTCKCGALRAEGAGICVDVQVTNTGSRFSGREVVQVYLSCPQNGQPRERRRLAGFSKTRLLHPGEGQTVAIHIPQKQLASFRPEQNAWVVDQGLYGVWIGNSSDRVSLCGLLQVERTAVLERTHPICPVEEPFEELGQAPGAAEWEEHLRQAQGKAARLPVYAGSAGSARTAEAPRGRKGPWKRWCRSFLATLHRGPVRWGHPAPGSPGSAGETSRVLEKTRGVPGLVMADGPAGLRLRQHYEVDRKTGHVYGTGVLGSLENGFLESPAPHADADTYYQFCTAFPVGTALAQTWDTELLTCIGRAVSREMEEFHVDLWLAPGMNLQRNPLCGRNLNISRRIRSFRAFWRPRLRGACRRPAAAALRSSISPATTRKTTAWPWMRAYPSARCGNCICAALRSPSRPPRPPR